MGEFSKHFPEMAISGIKIDPLSEIRNAGIVTNGSVFWTKASTDADYTTFQDQVGAANVRNTIQNSINQTRSDYNDYVLIVPQDANAVYTISTAIDVDEDRLHVLGVGGNNSSFYGLTVRGFATAAGGTPVDTEMINVTGGGVEMGGFRVLGTSGTSEGGTVTNGILRVGTASSGTAHDLYVHDMTLEANQAAGTPAIITSPGTVHNLKVVNSFIGNFAAIPESAGNAGLVRTGNGGKRWQFKDTTFLLNAGSTVDQHIACGTGATEYVKYDNCQFINVNSAQLLTSAIRGSVTTTNPVLLYYSTGINVTALGTDPTVYSVPSQSGTAGAGIHNPLIYLRGSAGVTAA